MPCPLLRIGNVAAGRSRAPTELHYAQPPSRGWSAGEDGAEPLEDTEVLRDRLQHQPEDAVPAVGQPIPTALTTWGRGGCIFSTCLAKAWT